MISTRNLPVTGPGWYAMTAAEYHADPCPKPSLSASIAKKILRQTPRHAQAAHPRLSGPKPESPTPAMLFGSVVHKLVLGAGARIKVIEADSYRTKEAQQQRDVALAAGRLPILQHEFDRADMVADAVRARCQKVDPTIFTGQPELVAIWQEGNVWCRAMMDSVMAGAGAFAIDDLKTSGQDISPFGVGKTIANMGYELQAAFYERGVKAIESGHVSVSFLFAFAEVDLPYEASVARLDGAAREIGRRQVCAAIEVWRRCLARNEWPGYPPQVVNAELPPWHIASWEAREQDDPLLEGVNY